MFKLYIHTKCSTCQKALRFIQNHRIPVELIDIQQYPPSKKELQKMLNLKDNNLKKLINTSGMLYKSLNLKHQLELLGAEKILDLLEKEGMLVKRPFLINQNVGLVGFNEEEWRQQLLHKGKA